VYVPTAFTPGTDGLNDIMRPILSSSYTLREFTIFSRWGQRIFSTTLPGKGWDGKLDGHFQNTGTYIWVIKVTDVQKKIIERKGTVTLIR